MLIFQIHPILLFNLPDYKDGTGIIQITVISPQITQDFNKDGITGITQIIAISLQITQDFNKDGTT